MGESNEEWGYLADDPQREAWDSYERVPSPGENLPLDAFLASKRLDHGALVRMGARLSNPITLAFAFDGGIKFRRLTTGDKWSWAGSTFEKLKIIEGTERDGKTVIVCEGETDAMRLTMLYPPADVAVMPAGATNWRETYTPDVVRYERVLVGLDSDQAGEVGWGKIRMAVPHAVRFAPPTGDWCELDGDPPPLPPPGDPPLPALVPAGQLLVLQVPESDSWFEDAVLPVGGTALLHGTYKSYKTWAALDMASALAQGTPWACFENTEEPALVAYLNFEVPWAYYRERVAKFASAAADRPRFDENFLSYHPITRPRLVAGDPKSEDAVLRDLTEGHVAVAFIDPVRRAMGFADLNAENEVRRILAFAERLTREGITVVMLHHDNKASDHAGGGDPSGMTGSGAWAGDADSIISISRPAGTERKDARRNVRFLLRNAPSPEPRGFELTEEGRVKWHSQPWPDHGHGDDDAPDLAQGGPPI